MEEEEEEEEEEAGDREESRETSKTYFLLFFFLLLFFLFTQHRQQLFLSRSCVPPPPPPPHPLPRLTLSERQSKFRRTLSCSFSRLLVSRMERERESFTGTANKFHLQNVHKPVCNSTRNGKSAKARHAAKLGVHSKTGVWL